MTELEILKLRKKQIDMQIKLLQHPFARITGDVLFDKIENAVNGFNYQVSVKMNYTQHHWDQKTLERVPVCVNIRYSPFIRERTREDVVDRIEKVIKDLSDLKEIIVSEKEENT